MVARLPVERPNATSYVDSVQCCRPKRSQGQGLKSYGAVWKNSSLHSHILNSIFKEHLNGFLCLCLCEHKSTCVFPVGVAANRILAQGFLSIRFWQKEQMGFSEVCFQLRVPSAAALLPQPPTSPRLQPLYPPRPAVRAAFCNFIKAPDHSFTVKAKARDLLKMCVSWNARPQVRVITH